MRTSIFVLSNVFLTLCNICLCSCVCFEPIIYHFYVLCTVCCDYYDSVGPIVSMTIYFLILFPEIKKQIISYTSFIVIHMFIVHNDCTSVTLY